MNEEHLGRLLLINRYGVSCLKRLVYDIPNKTRIIGFATKALTDKHIPDYIKRSTNVRDFLAAFHTVNNVEADHNIDLVISAKKYTVGDMIMVNIALTYKLMVHYALYSPTCVEFYYNEIDSNNQYAVENIARPLLNKDSHRTSAYTTTSNIDENYPIDDLIKVQFFGGDYEIGRQGLWVRNNVHA